MAHARASATSSAVTERTAALIERFFPSPRNFDVRLADGSVLSGGLPPVFTLVLTHPGALRRMGSPPVALSMAESFVYGDFDIEGDIVGAFSATDRSLNRTIHPREVLGLLRAVLALPRTGPARPAGRGPARLHGRRHSRERDLAAVRYHYDLGNDFFALWLDRRMQYSCAYFPTGQEDIDTAQERKLEHLCRKLRLRPGERVLDIGCGWGGLANYAAERFGVEVLGVTLSENQAEYARSRMHPSARVELRDYRDLAGESFDKIVSVGMFEHVGRPELPHYFGQAFRLLKPGGLFLNHGISSRPVTPRTGAPRRAVRPPSALKRFAASRVVGDGLFIERYIFPDGELVPVSEANLVAERAGFEVRDVENLREHYALTLRHWVRRLEQAHDEAVRMASEVSYRTWRLYMAAASYAFESGAITVNQTLLSKSIDGRASVPLTRADIYAT